MWPDSPMTTSWLSEGAGVRPSTWCEEGSGEMIISMMVESDAVAREKREEMRLCDWSSGILPSYFL